MISLSNGGKHTLRTQQEKRVEILPRSHSFPAVFIINDAKKAVGSHVCSVLLISAYRTERF